MMNYSNAEGDDESEVMFTPSIELPHVFELSYYANTVTSTFALESVVGMEYNYYLIKGFV